MYMAEHTVVVVHGVGDPQPGDALQGFVNAYCALTESRVSGALLVEQREDKDRDETPSGLVPLFPVSQQEATLDANGGTCRTRFVEVYWGDLARVKGTFLGLVEGTVDLIFGLRHIVFAAQRELTEAAKSTRMKLFPLGVASASTAALYLARGPILAINALMAIVTLLLLGLVSLPKDALARANPTLIAAAAGAVVTALIGLIAYRAAQRSRWSTTTATWLVVTGAATAAMLVFEGERVQSYTRFAEIATSALSSAAGLMALSVLLLLLLSMLTIAALDDRVHYPELIRRSGRRALIVINACTILSSALFVFAVMLGWAIVTKQMESAQVGEFTKAVAEGALQGKQGDEVARALVPAVEKAQVVTGVRKRITEGLHLFGLVWASLLLIAACYLGLALRSYWLKRSPVKEGRRFPRYIVHPVVVAMLVVAAIAWVSLFAPLLFKLECKHFMDEARCLRQLDEWPLYETAVTVAESGNATGVVLSGLLVSVLVIGRAHLGTALDIVLDVVSHFKRAEPSAPRKRASPKVAGNPQGFQFTELFHREPSEWNAMVARFRNVVEDALSKNRCDALTVIAHSQGTMIALEALGVITIERTDRNSSERRVQVRGSPKREVHLVTMGCPLADLYLHYFPGKYAISARADSLVASWRNIYRADDFVGTRITNAVDPAFPVNHQVGPRGHTDYWLDREVLEVVRQSMPGSLVPRRPDFTSGPSAHRAAASSASPHRGAHPRARASAAAPPAHAGRRT